MKHTHHIIRLLTLAVVSCALAALLSGCTKEEFIAGYNEFMFGDWFPTYGGTSQSGTSYDPDHVYDPPNPECDAKISSLLSQLYSLESSARSAVSSAISAAKDEYHALPAEERTFANKVSIAYKHLSSVESTYDSAVSSVVSEMRRVLREYNQPETGMELLSVCQEQHDLQPWRLTLNLIVHPRGPVLPDIRRTGPHLSCCRARRSRSADCRWSGPDYKTDS